MSEENKSPLQKLAETGPRVARNLADTGPVKAVRRVVQELNDPGILEDAWVDLGYHSADHSHPRESRRFSEE